MKVLADRLKWLREKERYSQKDIAEKIGMTVSGYQKIEYDQRDPKLDVLVNLSNIFNVSSDFLLGLKDVTYDLKALEDLMFIMKENISDLKDELDTASHNIIRLKSDFGSMGFENDVLENKRQELISTYEETKNNLEQKLYDNKNSLAIQLMLYVNYVREIPLTEIKNHSIIQALSPISFEIERSLFDEYSIILISSIGRLGSVGQYMSLEAAQGKINEIEELIK